MSGSYLIIKHCPLQPTNKCIKGECNHKIIDSIYTPFKYNEKIFIKYFSIINFNAVKCSEIIPKIEETISNLNKDYDLYPIYTYKNNENIERKYMNNFKIYLSKIFELIIEYPEYTLISSTFDKIHLNNYKKVDKSTNTEINIETEILYPKNLYSNKDKIQYINQIIKKCYDEISVLEDKNNIDNEWFNIDNEWFVDDYYIDSEGDSL